MDFSPCFIELAQAPGTEPSVCVPSASQLDLSKNIIGGHYEHEHDGDAKIVADPEGVQAIAGALRLNGALTSVDLKGNELGDEGWGAIFAAICGNKDSKIMSMDASCEDISPTGVQLIAEALRTSVTGALTSLLLAENELGDDGAVALSIGFKENKSLTSLDLRGKGYGGGCIGPLGATALASAIAVNGALTSIDLSNNNLTHYGTNMKGIKELAAALGVNGALTECNLQSNCLGAKGWTAIFTALRDSKVSKISTWDLHAEDGIKASIKPLAEYIAVSGGLTKMRYVSPQT
jgi:Ran GTPase-activating protein (RanGAP) involved in mRNA processing and transport